MKKLFAKKEVVKKEVVEFKELNDEQLDKIGIVESEWDLIFQNFLVNNYLGE